MDALYVKAISIIRSCKSTRQLPGAKKYFKLVIKNNNLPLGLRQQLEKEFSNHKSDLCHPDQIFFRGKYIFLERVIRNKITPKNTPFFLKNEGLLVGEEWMDF